MSTRSWLHGRLPWHFTLTPNFDPEFPAGVVTKAHERDKLERLCRYITRAAVSTKRLSLTRNGNLRYELKIPWRIGTTHVIFEPILQSI